MTRRRTNPDFLNGVPELVILQLLARRPMYGYELVQALKQTAGQTLAFGEGCIYPLLHRLEEEGSLTSRRETVGGRSRVVYRVSQKGKGKLQAATQRWRDVAHAVAAVLQGGQDELPSFSHQFAN
jgi:PadR family transcriptional regulator PadR